MNRKVGGSTGAPAEQGLRPQQIRRQIVAVHTVTHSHGLRPKGLHFDILIRPTKPSLLVSRQPGNYVLLVNSC